VVTADLDRLGAKAIGSVIDVELTTLPAEADAMHAGQTRHQKGVTAAETGVTVVEVVMATGVAEGMTGVTIGVVEGEGAEERLPSSLATGTAQTAAHIILQAVKPATSAMRPSEERPVVFDAKCFVRTACAGWLAWFGCIECMALGSAWLGSMVLVSFPRVWCWMCWLAARAWFICIRVWLQLRLKADWLWKGMEWCDRLAAGCSGSYPLVQQSIAPHELKCLGVMSDWQQKT